VDSLVQIRWLRRANLRRRRRRRRYGWRSMAASSIAAPTLQLPYPYYTNLSQSPTGA
jgi:hypothetical protein